MTLELKVAIGSRYEEICASLIEGIRKKEYSTQVTGSRDYACYFCGNKVTLISVLVTRTILDSEGRDLGKETFVLDSDCYFSAQQGKEKLPYKSIVGSGF